MIAHAVRGLLAALLVSFMPALVHAAGAYPERPLKLVVPYAPTGSADIEGTIRITKLDKMVQRLSTPPLTDNLSQQLAYAMSTTLEQSVYVERHSGEQTLAGARYVAQSAADGYTLLFAGNPTYTLYPALDPKSKFDPRAELAPVAAVARMPLALIALAGHPALSLGALIARARAAPQPTYYAALGENSTARIAGELLKAVSRTDLISVNYNGSLSALNAIITKQVDFGWVPLPAVLPYLSAGKLRILAIGAAQRHSALPQVATVAESGWLGFEADGWFGVFAPRATPESILNKLNAAIGRAMDEEGMQRYLAGLGLVSATGNRSRFGALIDSDRARVGRVFGNTPQR